MKAKNKIALVTGGSRGIGKNIALSLANKGINVIITYHTKKDEATEVIEQINSTGVNAVALKLSVDEINTFNSFFDQISAVLKKIFNTDRFDFLINNAGIGMNIPFVEITEEQFDLLVNTQFKGVYFLTQKALDYMNDGGAIINLSSRLAQASMPGYSAYASMKGAIETLTRYEAKEFAPRSIRVNAIAPGPIATDFAGGIIRDNTGYNANIKAFTALGRVGKADDIGGVVTFLCTDDARWITAQRIEVSGGMGL